MTMLKLVEVLLPLRQDAVDMFIDLPVGAKILKFGVRVEELKVQSAVLQLPGGPLATPQKDARLRPLVLCLLDTEQPMQTRHLFMATLGEPIPDGAAYLDMLGLPDGSILHLFEIPLRAALPQAQDTPRQLVTSGADV
jgi:hypothetical protein